MDASVIEADASRYQRVEGSDVDWTDAQKARRPVKEYLNALDTEFSPNNPDRVSIGTETGPLIGVQKGL